MEHDMQACAGQIKALEEANVAMQLAVDEKQQAMTRLSTELDAVKAQFSELTEQYAEMRRDQIAARSDAKSFQRIMDSTPGLQTPSDMAQSAIRRAATSKLKKESVAGSPQQHDSASHGAPGWSLKEWLGTTRVLEIVAEYLLLPLTELKPSERPSELGFVRALAAASGSQEALVALLAQHELRMLHELASEMHIAIGRLRERAPMHAREVCGKYVSNLDDGLALQPGGARAAEASLEELIGPPQPRVLEAMVMEHCEAADALVPFESPTYQLTSTPKIEWWWVVDPAEGKAKHVDVPGTLGHLDGARIGEHGYPAEGGVMATERARAPRALTDVMRDMQRQGIALKLRAVGVEPLLDAECIALRLHTGPMHIKCVDRSACTPLAPRSIVVHAQVLPSLSSMPRYNASLRGLRAGEGSPLFEHFERLCLGNAYGTTVHAINSAVVKLCKLGETRNLYRGVTAAVLPAWLWSSTEASDTSSARGGIEFGFLAATADAEQAMRFAADASEGTASARRIVLELQTCMLTRAADLSWISQYPHEQERALPPCACLELLGTRIDGTCVIVTLRLSQRSDAVTLRSITTKMKRSHMQLVETYLSDMRMCEVPEKAMGRLRALASTHNRYESPYFNDPEKYHASTAAAVLAQRHAITKLAHPSTWAEVEGDGPEKARKMEKAAAYCRRVGRADVAQALQHLASTFARGKGGWRPWRPGGSLPPGPALQSLA